MLLAEKRKQCTLKQAVSFIGTGQHSGKDIRMTVKPADVDTGIIFVRTDIDDAINRKISAHWKNIKQTSPTVTLANENAISVSVFAHILASLQRCQVDNAIIELDAPEAPVLKGSQDNFVSAMQQSGISTQQSYRKALWIRKPVEVHNGDKHALFIPSYTTRVTAEFTTPGTSPGIQRYSMSLLEDFQQNKISPTHSSRLQTDTRQSPSNGSFTDQLSSNFIQIENNLAPHSEETILSEEQMQLSTLSAIGILALLGAPVIGHLFTHNHDQDLLILLINKIIRTPDAWSYNADISIP